MRPTMSTRALLLAVGVTVLSSSAPPSRPRPPPRPPRPKKERMG